DLKTRKSEVMSPGSAVSQWRVSTDGKQLVYVLDTGLAVVRDLSTGLERRIESSRNFYGGWGITPTARPMLFSGGEKAVMIRDLETACIPDTLRLPGLAPGESDCKLGVDGQPVAGSS